MMLRILNNLMMMLGYAILILFFSMVISERRILYRLLKEGWIKHKQRR